MKAKVLLVGLKAEVVDFSKWPQLSEEKLNNAFQMILEQFADVNIDAEWCLTDTGETAADELKAKLNSSRYDVILVGAGVRTDADQFSLFETIINIIHIHAPNSKICFNTSPYDSVEAVNRYL